MLRSSQPSLNQKLLLFELLLRDIKNTDLPIPQTKAVQSKVLDTAFAAFDTFNNNKMRSNLSKKEFKTLHSLCKQKHLVSKKLTKATLLSSPR